MSIANNYKNIIFECGGIKGIAFAGSLQVLEAQSIMSNITNVSGSSTGAVIATLVALNYKSEEITNILLDTDFKKMKDGFNPFRIFTSYGLYKGDKFKKWIEDKIVKAGLPKDASFQMMSEYSNFKNLRIFATDLNTHYLQEFSVAQTPQVIVAEAVRASISIPLFFKSWQFSNKKPNDHLYIDGGVFYKNPLSIFKNLDETLGFHLYSPQSSNSNNTPRHSLLSSYVTALYDTILNSRNIEFQKKQAHLKNSIFINDLNISATDFGLSQEMKRKLMAHGKEATEKFLGVNRLFD